MPCRMDYGEYQHGVGDLPVEPDVFVEWQPSEFWSDPSHDGSAHRNQDDGAVERQHQAGASRYPDGIRQCVEPCKSGIAHLLVPARVS